METAKRGPKLVHFHRKLVHLKLRKRLTWPMSLNLHIVVASNFWSSSKQARSEYPHFMFVLEKWDICSNSRDNKFHKNLLISRCWVLCRCSYLCTTTPIIWSGGTHLQKEISAKSKQAQGPRCKNLSFPSFLFLVLHSHQIQKGLVSRGRPL